MKQPAHMPEFRTIVRDHVPYNKYRHQVEDSTCEVRIKDYDGTGPNPDAWTEIALSETYTPEGSTRTMSRTIHATLKPAQRTKLLRELTQREPAVEAALCWAKGQGFTGAGAALDDYCNARGLTWGEDYAGVVGINDPKKGG